MRRAPLSGTTEITRSSRTQCGGMPTSSTKWSGQKGGATALRDRLEPEKTFYAACIANALIDHGRSAKMTNFSAIINKLQESFDGRQRFLDKLNRFDLLIIDDLGIERESEYMQEQVYNIIDARYKARRPLIVTTNISLDEIKNPKSVQRQRIYDRILHFCHPVKIDQQAAGAKPCGIMTPSAQACLGYSGDNNAAIKRLARHRTERRTICSCGRGF